MNPTARGAQILGFGFLACGLIGFVVHIALMFSDVKTDTNAGKPMWYSVFLFFAAAHLLLDAHRLSKKTPSEEPLQLKPLDAFRVFFGFLWVFALAAASWLAGSTVKEVLSLWSALLMVCVGVDAYVVYLIIKWKDAYEPSKEAPQFKDAESPAHLHGAGGDGSKAGEQKKCCCNKQCCGVACYVCSWVVFLVFFSMAAFEVMQVSRDMRITYPPPGKLLDSGIHIHCKGSGKPVVVFLGGSSVPGFAWQETADLVAASGAATACTYDRGGYGWSYGGAVPRTSDAIAEELHEALDAVGHGDGPFILVPHSIGGQYTWAFARQFREKMVGLVLVDAQSPYNTDRTCPDTPVPMMVDMQRSLDTFGVTRIFARGGLSHAVLGRSAEYVSQMVAMVSQGRLSEAVWREVKDAPKSCKQNNDNWAALTTAANSAALKDLPVLVVSSGVNINATCANYEIADSAVCDMHLDIKKKINPMMALQGLVEARALSTRGQWLLIADADHDMWADAPSLLSEEILKMVSAADKWTADANIRLACRKGGRSSEPWCVNALCNWCSDAKACRDRVAAGGSAYCEDLNSRVFPAKECMGGVGVPPTGCNDANTCTEDRCLLKFLPVSVKEGGECPKGWTCLD